MYEHEATRPTCGSCASAAWRSSSRASGGWPRRASRGWGAWPSPRGCWRRARRCSRADAALARGEQPHRRAADGRASWRGLKVLVTAGGTREPIDSVQVHRQQLLGADGLRAGAGRARARRRGDAAGRERRADRPRRHRSPRRRHRGRAASRPASAEFPACDVLLMAAAVADFRPARAGGRGRSRRPAARSLELELEPTADVLAGLSSAAARRARRWSASPPSTASARSSMARGKLEREGPRRARRERHLARGHRLRGRRQRGHDPDRRAGGASRSIVQHVPRAAKAEVAEAILDAVERLRGLALSRPRCYARSRAFVPACRRRQ